MQTDDLFQLTSSQLTALSLGAGQESGAILEMLLDDAAFRQRYAPNDLLVAMSDTGDEHDETLAYVADAKARCEAAGVEFVFITADMGFHSKSWQSLRGFFREKQAIGSAAFPGTCTAQLKIGPWYRHLEHWLSKRYGVQCNKKAGLREFAARYGKIKVLIGFAKGEEKRIADPAKHPSRWFRESIEPVYPLIELGMDRQACQDVLHAKGLRVPPSNCKACHYASLQELEWKRRFIPADLADWVELEAAKLEKHKERNAIIVTDAEGKPVIGRNGKVRTVNKNYGVYGTKPLTVKIAEAKEKFGHWTDAALHEYRYSHGHCVKTSF